MLDPKLSHTQVILKNGTQVVIRQAKVTDAQNLLSTFKTYIPQSEFIPKLESEIKLRTLEQQEKWIRNLISAKNSILLVAEIDNEIVGNVDLTGSSRKVMEHTAVVGMGMLKDWRNTGLGTAMLTQAIRWAKENPVLELVWLQVYTDNVLGMSLYKKLGFVDNGVVKNFFKTEGRYYDNLTMSLEVK